jgi:hypothetical protein
MQGVPMSVKHRQAPITEDGGVIFSVDKKLQSLIQFYWDHGIDTFNSCQDNTGNTCWIQYALTDWMWMSEISFQTDSKALYRFIEEECKVLLLSSDDGHLDENDDCWIEGDELIWSASVRFKKSLLPKFEEIIRATFLELPLEKSDI